MSAPRRSLRQQLRDLQELHAHTVQKMQERIDRQYAIITRQQARIRELEDAPDEGDAS